MKPSASRASVGCGAAHIGAEGFSMSHKLTEVSYFHPMLVWKLRMFSDVISV